MKYEGFPRYISVKQNEPDQCYIPYAGETCGAAGCAVGTVMDGTQQSQLAQWKAACKWMDDSGYTVPGSGTWASGIGAYLRYKGISSEWLCDEAGHSLAGKGLENAYIKKFVDKIVDGYEGWILWGGVNTGCRNSYNCNNGHYSWCFGAKQMNGKTYLLIADPAFSLRDGWRPVDAVSVEGILGNIKQCGVVNIRWKAEAKPVETVAQTTYTATFPGIYYGMKDPTSKQKTMTYIWKENMIAAGFYKGKLNFTFDLALKTATENWQKSVNKGEQGTLVDGKLVVDGNPGPACFKQWYHFGQKKGNSLICTFKQKSSDGKRSHTTEYLIQPAGIARGMYKGEWDGKFGPMTKGFVEKFQEANNMKVTGVATPKVLSILCGGL